MSSYLAHKRKGFQGAAPLAFDGFGNRSRSFDGVDDEVVIADSPSFPTGAQTISAWVKTEDLGNYADVVSHWNNTGEAGFVILKLQDNQIAFYITNTGSTAGNGSRFTQTGSGNTINVGSWYHVACVFDPSNSIKIYLNGILEATNSTDIHSSIYNSGEDLRIGERADIANRNWHGNIADVRIYDTDLTATDISDLYNGTNITTNLVGHWLTDEDNVLDNAGSNNGTNNGTKYSYDNPSPPVEFGSASRIFNGTSDYIDLGNSTDFSFSDGLQDEPFSLCAWIKCDDNGTFRVLSKDNGSGGSKEWLLSTDGGGNLNIYLIDGGTFRSREYTTPLPENEWIHVASTYNGSGGENFRLGLKLYVNGVQVDNADFGSSGYVAMEASTNNDVFIGRYRTSYSDGKIADARIYDAELSSTDIASLYNGTDVTANLVGHYLTDNDDVEDKAGTNDGTNYGSTYSYDNPPMDLIPFGQRSRTFANDYINTNTGFQSVFQSSFSISTWVRFDDGVPSSSKMIFGNQSTPPVNRVMSFLDSSGGLTFSYFCNDIQARAEIDQNFSNGDTGWFHYTVVVEPTGITVYKDGSVQTLDATDDGDMSAVTMGDFGINLDFYIGARNLQGNPDLQMNGNIADFRIYDSSLSASDVTKIYNRTDDKSNIHAWYITNSDDVLDHAGTNDGTNYGSTYSIDSPS